MLELPGVNIWNIYSGYSGRSNHNHERETDLTKIYVGITTNSTIKSNGSLVMGRGVALQAKKRFEKHDLDRILGGLVQSRGNVPFIIDHLRLFTFPVKHNWHDDKADIDLIVKSAERLHELTTVNDSDNFYQDIKFYLPRPGCGNGGLNWNNQVKPKIKDILCDNVIIVNI